MPKLAEFPSQPDLGAPLAKGVTAFTDWLVGEISGFTTWLANLVTTVLLNPLQSLLADSPWWLMFFVVIWAERRWNLGHGRVFALYVMVYSVGRGAIETLRIDQVELNNVFGLRWSDWMSIICFVGALVYFIWASRNRPGRETRLYDEGREPASHDVDADAV